MKNLSSLRTLLFALCGVAVAWCSEGLAATSSTLAPVTSVSSHETSAPAIAVEVAVDPRVELVSIIFRLAGNDEYRRCRIPEYDKRLREHFARFGQHEIVKLARHLASEHRIGYDAPMSLAVRLPALEKWHAGGAVFVDMQGIDVRWRALEENGFLGGWKTSDLQKFAELLPRFAQETKFDEFLKANQALYAQTCERARALVAGAHLEWFNTFFEKRAGVSFLVVPSLVNGPCNYGVCRGRGAHQEYFCILGVGERDPSGQPRFPDSMRGTVVHEFGHSYVNPVVEAHADQLRPAAQRLFVLVDTQMKQQAYGDWHTMMIESLNRACEARYEGDVLGAAAYERAVRDNVERGFRWTGELAELLKEYEQHRDRYATLDAFFPRVVEFFEAQSRKQADVARKQGPAPRVVKSEPPNGSSNVSPQLREVTVTFDCDMQPGYVLGKCSPDSYPKVTGKAHWRDARTCVLPVSLEPGKLYRIGINRGYEGFKSVQGASVKSTELRFSTGAQ